jgi:acetyltransferase-like isoleucine patch superfamily enzyme
MTEKNNYSLTYRFLRALGITLSPKSYGNISFIRFFAKTMIYWKNEILQSIARHWMILAPLNARVLRPMLHRWRGVHVGKRVLIGTDVMLDSIYPKKIQLGDGVMLANRVMILAHNRDLSYYHPGLKIQDLGYIVKDTIIEDEASIMIGATILTGVRVGKGAIVAAGSIVNKDVRPYTVVGGIPAREIKEYDYPPGYESPKDEDI